MIIILIFFTATKDELTVENEVLHLCSRLLVHISRFVYSSRALIVRTGIISTLLNALGIYKDYSDPSQVGWEGMYTFV